VTAEIATNFAERHRPAGTHQEQSLLSMIALSTKTMFILQLSSHLTLCDNVHSAGTLSLFTGW